MVVFGEIAFLECKKRKVAMNTWDKFEAIEQTGRKYLRKSEYTPLIKEMIEKGSIKKGERIPIEVMLVGRPRLDIRKEVIDKLKEMNLVDEN